jgi:hypothetical protein
MPFVVLLSHLHLPWLPLQVPSDIDIAQAVNPRPILEVAESIGLKWEDIDMYGQYKAKV